MTSPAAPVGPLAILGPGTLGLAAAAWAAERGIHARLAGRDSAHAEEGLARIHARWRRRVERIRLAEAARVEAAHHLRACSSVDEALDGAGAVLEALPEHLEAKRAAWGRIHAAAGPAVLLLTGTSSLSLASLRQGIAAPGRILGFHLFLPLEHMRALELVSEPGTDPRWVAAAEALGQELGRTVFRIQDGSGFAASRMALAQGLEAIRLLEAGVASAETLDGLMVHGYGHPMGPLELSDRIGLDLRLDICRGLHAATSDPRFAPPGLLVSLVQDGALGRKAGRGFHRWDDRGNRR